MTIRITKKRIVVSAFLTLLAISLICFIFVLSGTRESGLEAIGKSIAKEVALQTEPGEFEIPEHNKKEYVVNNQMQKKREE